ncbi:MAG: 6-bladed beta-propeller [Bacteroidota bacterium]
MRNRMLVPFLFLLSILMMTLSCSRRTEQRKYSLPKDIAMKIASKTSFNELFEKVEEIQLKSDAHHLIGDLSAVTFLKNGDIVVADNPGKQLLLFTSDGKFKKQIGRYGAGPGEYRRIADLTVSSTGDLLVLERMRVTRFDSLGNYKASYPVTNGYAIAPTEDDGFYVYDVYSPPQTGAKVIHKYDRNGREEKSFGSPSSHMMVDGIPIVGGTIAVDRVGDVFAVHVSEYEVKKFNSDGDSLGVLSHKNSIYHPLESPVSPYDTAKLNAFTAVSPILVLRNGVVIVCLSRSRPRPSFLELYDVNGHFLTGGIQLPNEIAPLRKSVSTDDIVHFQKRIEEVRMDSQGNLPPPRIIAYKLRL